MSETMNRYELLAPFQNKNAGFSRWTYATRDGRDYFLKEFMDPVYPTDESLAVELRTKRVKDCEEFELKKKALYEAINRVSDGNVVRIAEFFRYDNHYYLATERIQTQSISMGEISSLPYEDRFLLCKSLAHGMMKLHQEHIVHADIKESNVLIKRTQKGKLVAKIIDFDASFFENDPPQYEDELGGDQVYLAPEACQFICGESIELTTKMDVFAVGLLFHQYLIGKLPGFDTEEYDYAFDAVLDGQGLVISSDLNVMLQEMLRGMLECDPKKRLSIQEVYSVLENIDPNNSKKGKKDAESKEKKAETMKVYSPSDWFYSAGDL